MPQMAVGKNQRLLGSHGGDEEPMRSGLKAWRASLTTSHSPAIHTRPPPTHPFIVAAAFRGTLSHWEGLRLDKQRFCRYFGVLGSLVIEFAFTPHSLPHTLWYVPTREGCPHPVLFLPSSLNLGHDWVRKTPQELPPAVLYCSKFEYELHTRTRAHTQTHVPWHGHTSMLICFNVYWHRCMQRPSPSLWWCQIRKLGERAGVLMKENAGRWRWLFFFFVWFFSLAPHAIQAGTKHFRHPRLAFISDLFSQSSFKHWHMAVDVPVNFTALSCTGLTLVLPCLQPFVCCSVLVWTVALMFWPPPREASWLWLNCEGKQMQPPSPSWMEVEDDPGNLWEPQWKSLSCWECTMSVKCVVSSEHGSNQNHITVSQIQFSSWFVSVYSIQTLFFVNLETEPGTSHHGQKSPWHQEVIGRDTGSPILVSCLCWIVLFEQETP